MEKRRFIPACCFFFFLTALDMICVSSSSDAPDLIISRNEISLGPNKHAWEVEKGISNNPVIQLSIISKKTDWIIDITWPVNILP